MVATAREMRQQSSELTGAIARFVDQVRAA